MDGNCDAAGKGLFFGIVIYLPSEKHIFSCRLIP